LNSQTILNSLADLAYALTRLIETVPFVGDVAVRISPWLGLSIMVSPGLPGAFRRSIGGTLAGVVMGLFGVTIAVSAGLRGGWLLWLAGWIVSAVLGARKARRFA
jgi:hypothetical protein